MSIVKPIFHRSKVTKKVLFVVMVSVWLFGFAFSSSYIVPSCGLVPADVVGVRVTLATGRKSKCELFSRYPSLTFQRTVGLIIIVVQYVIPLTCISYCYAVIFIRLSADRREAGVGCGRRGDKTAMRVRRNVIRTLLAVSACFVICWTPNEVYYMAHNFGLPVDFDAPLYNLSVMLVFVNCCVNPVIYTFTYTRFRHAVRDMFSTRACIEARRTRSRDTSSIDDQDTPSTTQASLPSNCEVYCVPEPQHSK